MTEKERKRRGRQRRKQRNFPLKINLQTKFLKHIRKIFLKRLAPKSIIKK